MHRNNSSTLLRSAALILGAMALLTTPSGAQSPTGTSPNVPTPFSWPSFHAGRYEEPKTEGNFINELMGTPTGIFTVPVTYPPVRPTPVDVWTQFPSFLLGNYDPASPPGTFGLGPAYQVAYSDLHNFRPNTFNTHNIAYWLAPYAYADALNSTTTVDDKDGAPNFTLPTGIWTNVAVDPTGTATNNEYFSAPVASGGSTAAWSLKIVNAGTYSIVAHVPIGAATPSTDASYTITYTGLVTPIKVRVSQAQGGTLTLFSPINLPAGVTLTVTLDDSQNTSAPATIVYADSVSILNASTDTQIVDEDNTHNTGTPFALAGPGAALWTPVVITPTTPQAASASFASYLRAPAVNVVPATAAQRTTANWTFNPTQTGLFQASLHIPDADNLASGAAGKEYRITDAHYTVTVTHNLVASKVVDVRISQTEANG